MPITAHDIIVIAASLGGVETVCKLLNGLPSSLNASVLIVVHTSPQSPRMLAQVLGRCTQLKVSYPAAQGWLEPGHAYVAPPDHHMRVLFPGIVGLDQGAKVRHTRPAADPLFHSAAAVYGPRVIGVVLTGLDGDGTDGLQSIKAAGGLSVVQDPSEAIAPDMPLNALVANEPDYVALVEEMPAILIGLLKDRAT